MGQGMAAQLQQAAIETGTGLMTQGTQALQSGLTQGIGQVQSRLAQGMSQLTGQPMMIPQQLPPQLPPQQLPPVQQCYAMAAQSSSQQEQVAKLQQCLAMLQQAQ
jgi:hypothetical protein